MTVINFASALTDREMKQSWQTCRDCVAGEARIKAAAETYLPRPEGMGLPAYRNWLKRTSYLNTMRSTIDAIIGRIYRKEEIVSFPDERLPFLCHGEEQSWAWGAQFITREVLTVGRVFAIVLPEGKSQFQPGRILLYLAEEVDDWREDRGRLVMVRVHDACCRENEAIEYRLDESGLFEAATVNTEGETIAVAVPSIGGRRLDYLPGTFIGASDLSPCPQQPPLLDLANRSIAFYVLAAEYRQALYYTASPQPVATGFAKDELPKTIGPNTIISSRNPAARFSFATFSGDGLAEMRAALTELKAEMAGLGASMLLPKSASNVAARTVELRQREDTSVAVSVVSTVEAGINRLMRFILDWEGSKADASIRINRDLIEAQIDPNLMRALREAFLAEMISWETWIECLKSGEIIPASRSADDERNLIALDARTEEAAA